MDPEDIIAGGILGLILSMLVGGWAPWKKKPLDEVQGAVAEHVDELEHGAVTA